MSITVAYADPPYIGQSRKHYKDHPDYAGEVDHRQLVDRLCSEYPDGWALSLSSPTLGQILSYCPDDVRVMSWVKPFAIFKPGVNPAYAWEPVIVRGGRKRDRHQPTVRDWVSANITLKRGLSGVKPEQFCFWLFEVLGLQLEDTLIDLFPGSGAVTQAWEQWKAQLAEFDREAFAQAATKMFAPRQSRPAPEPVVAAVTVEQGVLFDMQAVA